MSQSIPSCHLEFLRLTADNADALAEAGEFAAGAELYYRALWRIEQALETGEEWPAALIRRCRAELMDYFHRNGR